MSTPPLWYAPRSRRKNADDDTRSGSGQGRAGDSAHQRGASYPDMSKYQVMKARVFLIDLYISHKIYGNAFDLCQLTLEEYPKSPIKRKLKAMGKIRDESPEEFVHSRNVDMVDSDLCFSEESGVEDYDPEFEARLHRLPSSLKDTFYLPEKRAITYLSL